MRSWHQASVVGACAAALTSSLVLAGCKPPCQGAACAKDAGVVVGCVPDQTFDQASAVPLTSGTPATGLVCPVLDKDFYAFTTGAGDTLAEVSLTTTTVFSQVNLSGSVINAAGQSLGHMQDPNGTDGPTDIRMVVKLSPNTQYFVVVGDLNNANSDGAGEYSLTVRTFPDPDTHEPNSADMPTAADITATGNSGWLSATGDVDVYRFDAAAGSILRFELSIPEAHDAMGAVVPPRVSPQAVISDATGNSIYASPAVPVAGVNGIRRVRTNVAIKGTGPFTCIVSDNMGGADFRTVEGNYTLRLEVIPDPDVDERSLPARNDTLATTIKVAPGGDVHPAVSTVGDVDNYMVTVGAADGSSGRKVLVVNINLPPGTPEVNFQPVVSLWDQVLSTGNQSGNCLNPAGPGAHRYLCKKPCGAGSVCQGSPGGDQQECMAADPDMPTVDRYCAEPHIFRALKVQPDGSINQTVRYSLRSGRSPVVQLGDQLSDSYDERPFTIHISVMDDPDTHEPDDLPPPLLAVGGSGTDVRKRDLATFVHPTMNTGAGYLPLCPVGLDPDGGLPPDAGTACLSRSPIADGGPTDPTMLPINCGNFDETTMTVTGFLAYEGDHDYYRFDVPEGFYSLDLEYSYDPPGGGTTPVELAAFIYTADSNGDMPGFIPLRGSFVNTRQVQSVGANVNCQFDTGCPGQQRCAVRPGMGDCKLNTGEIVGSGCSSDGDCAQGVCRPNGPTGGVCYGDCVSSAECTNPDAGITSAVCIKNPGGSGICFQDEDNNAGTGNRVFGPSGPGGECLFANQCNIRPFYVEVVDNGLNDSDPLTPYTLRMHIKCGCPAAACGGGNTCTYIDCSVGN